jgi:acyl dehydratase
MLVVPLSSFIVGERTEAIVHRVSPRWTMAFAAALDDLLPCYVDTTAPDPVIAHPLFPVCVEWPSVLEWRRRSPDHGLTREEAVRGVHAGHELIIHRPVRAGDTLSTTATVERIEQRSPGAYQVLRLDTVDERGEPVSTTLMGSLFLGVDVNGADTSLPTESRPTKPDDLGPVREHHQVLLPVAANAAHIYTECSRIWNPIHTDVAVARAAGLPAPILHGTATLAMAVSEVVRRVTAGDPARVRRIGARFAAMVTMPSVITVDIDQRARGVSFTVTNADGLAAVRDGLVVVDP